MNTTITTYLGTQEIEKGFQQKKWWASLDEEVRREMADKKRINAKKGSDSPIWKGGKEGVCSICRGKTSRKSADKCSQCYHKSQLKNPLKNGKYTHAKGKCVECSKELSDTYRTLCRSCSHKGERSHHWKGGVTKERTRVRLSIESKLWRDSVLIRDNFTCQKTGKRGGNMEVHHIMNFSQYPELRFAIDNGITLSKKAHNDFHRIYGKKDNNREQLIQFLTN